MKITFQEKNKACAFDIPRKNIKKVLEEKTIMQQFFEHAVYQLFIKEKSNKLKDELISLKGKKDKKSQKRVKEILNFNLHDLI